MHLTLDAPIKRIYIKSHGAHVRPREGRRQHRQAWRVAGGLSGFDGEPHVAIDARYDYGETRYQARGRIGGIGHCAVFTVTATGIHLISFRRAHEKEMRRYE
jgi:hypothetical protein